MPASDRFREPAPFAVVADDLALLLRSERSVLRGHAVVRRALEDVQLLRVLGDLRDRLDRGGAGADHGDALSAEVDPLGRPLASVKPLAFEVIEARERRALDRRQIAGCHHTPAAGQGVLLRGGDHPLVVLVVEAGGLHLGVELDIAPEIEAVGNVIEVAQDLRLRRVSLAPDPLVQQLVRERVAVVDALDIAACAGVAVPEPGAPHPGAAFQHPGRVSKLAQPVQREQAGEPGTDDDHFIVLRAAAAVVHIHAS